MGEDPATVNMFQGAPEGHPNPDSGHSRALYRNEECYKAHYSETLRGGQLLKNTQRVHRWGPLGTASRERSHGAGF